MINSSICCCLRPKSKQIAILSQKSSFNGYAEVIGYVDPEYDIVNNIWCIRVVKKVIPQITKIRGNFSPTEGRRPECGYEVCATRVARAR